MRMADLDDKLTEIVKKNFTFNSLETKNSSEDFQEVAIWQIEQALKEAVLLGMDIERNRR